MDSFEIVEATGLNDFELEKFDILNDSKQTKYTKLKTYRDLQVEHTKILQYKYANQEEIKSKNFGFILVAFSEEKKIVGRLIIAIKNLKIEKQGEKIGYLFGLLVDKKFQNKQLQNELIKKAFQISEQRFNCNVFYARLEALDTSTQKILEKDFQFIPYAQRYEVKSQPQIRYNEFSKRSSHSYVLKNNKTVVFEQLTSQKEILKYVTNYNNKTKTVFQIENFEQEILNSTKFQGCFILRSYDHTDIAGVLLLSENRTFTKKIQKFLGIRAEIMGNTVFNNFIYTVLLISLLIISFTISISFNLNFYLLIAIGFLIYGFLAHIYSSLINFVQAETHDFAWVFNPFYFGQEKIQSEMMRLLLQLIVKYVRKYGYLTVKSCIDGKSEFLNDFSAFFQATKDTNVFTQMEAVKRYQIYIKINDKHQQNYPILDKQNLDTFFYHDPRDLI